MTFSGEEYYEIRCEVERDLTEEKRREIESNAREELEMDFAHEKRLQIRDEERDLTRQITRMELESELKEKLSKEYEGKLADLTSVYEKRIWKIKRDDAITLRFTIGIPLTILILWAMTLASS